ncbi:MAG: hypothetical protein LBU17_10245 [Treponema sp.]|jgi:hypothetical protein|nr:hypothetical protein [Treponema sp.]
MGNQLEYQEKLYEYNLTRPSEQDKRQQMLLGIIEKKQWRTAQIRITAVYAKRLTVS